MTLIEVANLAVHFPVRSSFLSRPKQHVKAVDDVSFAIHAGETLGLVGESGCGKTTLARAIVRLLKPSSGTIRFENIDLAQLTQNELRPLRRKLQMIFQDPFSSLNPRMTVEQIIGEALEIHRLTPKRAATQNRIGELLTAVGLNPEHAQRFPNEFSGGQRQRIGIARALAVEPKLIICDEPVSALDVSVQAQIINLLKDLQQSSGISYLFIAHDLAVVEHMSHHIVVMYLGKIVESAPAKAIVSSPRHPYTEALISAVPVLDPSTKLKKIVLSGDAPSPVHPPSGCPFHTRCPKAQFPRCQAEIPALREVAPGHWAACHFA
jgi:oligopeptide transport system ATP-binding protein